MALVISTEASTDTDSESRNIFRYQDLPAEIRNRINFNALAAENEIRITRYEYKDGSVSTSGKRQRQYRIKGTTLIIVGKKKRKSFPVTGLHSLSLLRVCKAIYAEATPIFYGSNRFVFQSVNALEIFKNETGQSFSLLKDIEITSASRSNIENLRLSALKPTRIILHLTNPRSIYHASQAVWLAIKTFVTKHDEWQYTDSPVHGWYETSSIKSIEEQKKRFDTFFFNIPLVNRLLGPTFSTFSREQAHELFKTAVLKRWDEYVENVKQREARGQQKAQQHEKAREKAKILAFFEEASLYDPLLASNGDESGSGSESEA